jgi:hypothetical protein
MKIRLVIATRVNEKDFFEKTATGRSIAIRRPEFVEVRLFSNNKMGLSKLYNQAIFEAINNPAILIFIHDDIHILDYYWFDRVKEAIKNGKYYGFKNLTVQKFVNAKNINIEKVSLDGPSVADFYNENKGYKWINKPDKTTNCKKAICKNIINMDDISQVINYENLGINKEDNKDCYTSDGSDRVLFDTEATIMNYWEEDCSKILQSEGIA